MRPTLLLAVCVLASCRPDPGVPDYSTIDGLLDAGASQGPLPGPFPYVPGTRRLVFGIFYEGEHSELIAVDDATRHYYIFEGTYVQRTSNDRVEGLSSDELIFTGGPWWGGGLVWDKPVDLREWTTLHVSLASPDTGLAQVSLRLLHGTSTTANEAVVDATAHGWVNDGDWHHLAVPLSAFAGADLSKVRGPFVIGGVGARGGEKLLVDNLYFE